MITIDGIYYEGEVSQYLAHGKGIFVNQPKGYKYEGEWLHNKPDGAGIE